jgi:hypothetical protein
MAGRVVASSEDTRAGRPSRTTEPNVIDLGKGHTSELSTDDRTE